MQLQLQARQVARGLQEELGQDLLLLPGVGRHGDGVPDLDQDRLERMEEEEEEEEGERGLMDRISHFLISEESKRVNDWLDDARIFVRTVKNGPLKFSLFRPAEIKALLRD